MPKTPGLSLPIIIMAVECCKDPPVQQQSGLEPILKRGALPPDPSPAAAIQGRLGG